MPLSDLNREMWLWLFNEGGYWTASDIAHRTGHDALLIFRGLGAMHRRGLLASKKEGRWKAYGVTGTCFVPKGMRIAEVQG